jgi:energy-converting hydrogenase Eha subunit G
LCNAGRPATATLLVLATEKEVKLYFSSIWIGFYVKYLGGFSGGDIITSGIEFEVSLKRKHRNDSFIG